jgi:hypothetical protein
VRTAITDGSATVEKVRGEVAGLIDLMNLEHELAKLKEEMRAMRPKPEPFAPPAADVVVAPKKAATAERKPPGSPPTTALPPRNSPQWRRLRSSILLTFCTYDARSSPIVTSVTRADNDGFDSIRVDSKNMPKTATIR